MNVRFKTAIGIMGDEKSKGLQLATRQGSPLIRGRTGLGAGRGEAGEAKLVLASSDYHLQPHLFKGGNLPPTGKELDLW